MAARVAQYVTVIDRSNKVIGNSKQFKDVFREAKAAYLDRKAEIKAQRRAREEAELQKALEAVTLQEAERASTRAVGHGGYPPQSYAPSGRNSPTEYDYTGRQRAHGNPRSRSGHATPREDGPRQVSLGEFNDRMYGPERAPGLLRRQSHTVQASPEPWDDYDPAARGLARAQTDLPLAQIRKPGPLVRAQSADDVDLDLAYGDYHPESLVVASNEAKEKELQGLVARCKGLLEEADCAGHSAKAIIANLQKNPDTLAAVGLTLAEISTIASKMAPGAMGMIAKSAPAVMALLVSPQFLIAVGVSVGVTVIAIGGYKIVKRMKEKTGIEGGTQGPEHDEAIDVRELDHIERWRRGIPEPALMDDSSTVISGTSVEGEFITPFAAQSMGHLPPRSSAGRSKSMKKIKDKDKDSRKSEKGDKRKHKHHRSDVDDSSTVISHSSSGSARRSSTSRTKDKTTVKTKKPSPLSRMFSSGISVRE